MDIAPIAPHHSLQSQVIRERKQALSRFRSSPTLLLTNLIAFKHIRALARRTITNGKLLSWSTFAKSLNYSSSSTDFSNRVGKFKSRSSNSIAGLYSEGAWNSNPSVIPNILAKHFASVSGNDNHSTSQPFSGFAGSTSNPF
ncbi:hypothetical protein GWI33_006582 [Rhynchophorus ferrugineus]|uniref:Uncharacterized protein n=1 Tax=Rhynchophorus ferrugineus TaxID=354439 RepID=A0A834MCW7_RHYFE|nr:hypothetical protein GWI33_006582 [Rhynchophorus ferrugineus]